MSHFITPAEAKQANEERVAQEVEETRRFLESSIAEFLERNPHGGEYICNFQFENYVSNDDVAIVAAKMFSSGWFVSWYRTEVPDYIHIQISDKPIMTPPPPPPITLLQKFSNFSIWHHILTFCGLNRPWWKV